MRGCADRSVGRKSKKRLARFRNLVCRGDNVFAILKRASYGQSGLGAVWVVNPGRRLGGSEPRGLGANVER